MHVELSFDLVLDLHFLVTGRFPIALRDEIAKHKQEIYDGLTQDPDRPDMLSVAREIDAAGRRFYVLFSSDKHQVDPDSDARPLRVIDIIEMQKK
ncbi:MAG TPA: hypothetical protein VLW06_16575 [Terriglobales bacterium]|nr:hypothetical protein [Terriglobales bacterium]